ncbi:hypothetical protein CMEL01_11372 [Colletotrichum melonis]|uniref:Uncharacterized protein n=1 Tax=Colletotrichum melonis TaxID=1209925 RepID=A0AAI9V2A5_9PEZI|nr:hypothetical protein CMEL01_11372 [Colletotrichum melonis]
MITHHQISHFSPIGNDALSMSTHVQLRRSSSSRPILPSGGRKRLLGMEYVYGPYRLQSMYSLSRQKQQTNPAGIIAMGHQLSIKAHAESYPNLDLPELAHRKSSRQQQRIPSPIASPPVSVTQHKANYHGSSFLSGSAPDWGCWDSPPNDPSLLKFETQLCFLAGFPKMATPKATYFCARLIRVIRCSFLSDLRHGINLCQQ